MTIKQAIERLNFMIQQHVCYEEVVLEDDNEDAQEELHETEVELEARANDVGYSVTLRINGRAFAASAIVANGDTVGSTYKQIVTQLAEVYGDIDRKPEYADIAAARDETYFTICSLNKIARLGG